jgi:hypothetical protein
MHLCSQFEHCIQWQQFFSNVYYYVTRLSIAQIVPLIGKSEALRGLQYLFARSLSLVCHVKVHGEGCNATNNHDV